VLIDLASWIFLPNLSQTDIGLAAIHTHKNVLGLAMMFSEFVCAPYIVSRKTTPARAFWLFIVLAAFALLIASRSKTSLSITIVAYLIVPLLLGILSWRRAPVLAVALLLVATVAFAGLGWLAMSYDTGADPLAPTHGITFTQRTDVWQFVIEQIRLRPWGGAGFGSFWDIDPNLQPGYQTDLWFFQPDAPTNEAHEGYLDILVTTGFIGFGAVLFVLLRWVGRGLALLRGALRSDDPRVRDGIPYLTFLAVFPMLIFVHNFTESSYFTTAGLFSFIVVLNGVDVEMRYPKRPLWLRPRLLVERPQPVLP
jgi:O-antigen ligase